MSKNISDYSPQEYKHIYRQLNKAQRNCTDKEQQELATIKSDAQSEINVLNANLSNVRAQYVIDNRGSSIVYIDHVESGGYTISFDEPYEIEPYVTKIRETYGYYQNGKPRTHLVKYSFARFVSLSSGHSIDVAAGSTKTEAKQLIKDLKQKIAINATKKPELDHQSTEIEQKIQQAEAKLTSDITNVQEKYQNQRQKYSDAINRLLKSGNAGQYKYLFRPSRTVLLACLLLPGLLFLLSSISGYSTFFKTIAESRFNYNISTNDEQTFDCNLNYDQDKHYFYCQQQSYTAEVVKTAETDPSNANGRLKSSDSTSFTATVPLQVIPSSEWAIEDISFNKTAEKYSKSSDRLSLYNSFLGLTVAQKEIKVNWKFSQDDKDLMRKVWSEWKTEQENKAREQLAAEKKAAEEAAKKAAEEARKKAAEEAAKKAEEARKKAAEEAAKRAEEARKKAAEEEARRQQTYTAPKSSGSSSSGNSKPSSGSSSSSGTGITGYCKDGTPAYGNPSARGRANSCYGHGGWQR